MVRAKVAIRACRAKAPRPAPIPRSTADSRNGIRQPQDRNASPGSRVTMASTTVDRTAPAGAPMLAKLAEKPFTLVGVFQRHQRGAAPFTADREALDQPQHDEQDRGEDPDGLVGGQQANREAGRA